MFFELSKIIGFLFEPLNLLALLLVAATLLVWSGRPKAGRNLLTVVTLCICAVALLPVTDALLIPLEQRFKAGPVPERVDGIILLGGAQKPVLTNLLRQPVMREGAETMTTFLALARKYPTAKLVFSGGSGDIRHQEVSEAETVRLFLNQQGFDSNKVLYESKSRNTYENGLFSRRLAKPKPQEVWLLVTSASAMPRAVGVFRRLGWPVVPVPCHYRANPARDFEPSLSITETFVDLRDGVHEWVGLAAYFATGKTDSLFPGP